MPVNSSRTLNNASSSEAVINSTTGNTITTKSGTSKEGTLNYAPAGLLEVLKSFDINKFGDWFVENFVLIISCIIVISMGYIFWVAYVRDREI
ncbi:MAG: hypothetical protein NTY04_02115 [Candidatus Staskawiczbacteria bacterium]|nr:hypothetical protein [Candidatus Staskawiczbacteria bacterium]